MRALLAIVIGMGVLLAAGTVTLVVLLISRSQTSLPHESAILNEPAGTHIVQAEPTDHDRLLLLLQGGGPDRAVFYDLRHEQEISRVTLAR